MATLTRTFTFVRKEIVDVVRQPKLLLALVVGPFLILFAFGAGLRDTDPPMRTVLVAAEDSEVREDVDEFAEEQQEERRLVIDGVTADRGGALVRLGAGELDLVIVFPDEVASSVQDDERAVITLYHNQIDPVEGRAIELFSRSAVDEINDRVLATVVGDLQERVREAGAGPVGADDRAEDYLALEPAVLVAPFVGESRTLAGRTIELTDFYAPAVVVVLLQHLAVTLLGLSVVRERALGATHLFRVSPLRAGEYLAGKFLSFIVLGGVVGTALVAGMVWLLGTPMAGSWWQLAVTLLVFLLTTTALGLVLSLVAETDSQAVQYSMLVLLATIFLSGFLLSLDRFLPFARPLALLLPATYAIELTRDVMLRGVQLDGMVLGGLAAYGVVFTIVGARLVRRMTRPVVAA